MADPAPHPKNAAAPSLELDLSAATPDLCAALVKAQADVETVVGDSHNDQLKKKYVSGEAMIAASKKVFKANGLALISTFNTRSRDVPPGDIGHQFVCGTVVETFALVHEAGGSITGRASLDAIGSKARPNDKAVAATATYMHGYLLRHLLNIARDKDGDGADGVDQRDDDKGFTPPQKTESKRQSRAQPSGEEKLAGLRRAVAKRVEELFAADSKWDAMATTEGEGKARSMLFESLGVPTTGRLGAEHLRTVNEFLKERLAALADDKPADYDAGDGKDLETGEEPGEKP